MRPLLAALTLSLASCASTLSAADQMQTNALELRMALADMHQATLDGASQEELDAIDARVQAELAALREDAEQLRAAVAEDLEAAREGLTGLGAMGDGGVVGLGLTALAWWMRDRRKALGKDPLQRPSTPPVIPGGPS